MNMMELQGILKAIQPIVERNNFKSRKVWITTEDNPQYPQTIEIEVQQDKVTMFDGISIGAPVTCSINLRGREWTNPEGKTVVFNSLICWKVQAGQQARPAPASPAGFSAPDIQPVDDLPF